MHTPQKNPVGYDNSSISDMSALEQNVRFLVMHGVSDDNVHFQNSLNLLDKLDLASVDNYDIHVFPDSDHSILFHNAHKMVYNRELFPITLSCLHQTRLTRKKAFRIGSSMLSTVNGTTSRIPSLRNRYGSVSSALFHFSLIFFLSF